MTIPVSGMLNVSSRLTDDRSLAVPANESRISRFFSSSTNTSSGTSTPTQATSSTRHSPNVIAGPDEYDEKDATPTATPRRHDDLGLVSGRVYDAEVMQQQQSTPFNVGVGWPAKPGTMSTNKEDWRAVGSPPRANYMANKQNQQQQNQQQQQQQQHNHQTSPFAVPMLSQPFGMGSFSLPSTMSTSSVTSMASSISSLPQLDFDSVIGSSVMRPATTSSSGFSNGANSNYSRERANAAAVSAVGDRGHMFVPGMAGQNNNNSYGSNGSIGTGAGETYALFDYDPSLGEFSRTRSYSDVSSDVSRAAALGNRTRSHSHSHSDTSRFFNALPDEAELESGDVDMLMMGGDQYNSGSLPLSSHRIGYSPPIPESLWDTIQNGGDDDNVDVDASFQSDSMYQIDPLEDIDIARHMERMHFTDTYSGVGNGNGNNNGNGVGYNGQVRFNGGYEFLNSANQMPSNGPRANASLPMAINNNNNNNGPNNNGGGGYRPSSAAAAFANGFGSAGFNVSPPLQTEYHQSYGHMYSTNGGGGLAMPYGSHPVHTQFQHMHTPAPPPQQQQQQNQPFFRGSGGMGASSQAYFDPSSNNDNGAMAQSLPDFASMRFIEYYRVEFKAGRAACYYVEDCRKASYKVEDLVMVEADRGRDLGKIVDKGPHCSDQDAKAIIRLAYPPEINQMVIKAQDEMRALMTCQTKIRQKKMPMEVVDAEYQWDRRKLTYSFVADRRIDFRELVRELFKIYKTRIWMCLLDEKAPAKQQRVGK